MSESIRLSFSGYLSLREEDHFIVARLQEESETIGKEIAERLGEVLGATPNVSVDFTEGSLEWFGWVEWVRTAWPSVEVLSTVGGAIGLIQLVKSAVDGVLRRWFRRALGPRPFRPYPSSRVILISVPSAAVASRSSIALQQRMIGLAALVASASLFIAAVAVLIAVLR
jgi:hypothetical protein